MSTQPVLYQLAQLEEQLAALGDRVPPLIAVHGMLTAIAAGPEPLQPAQWLGYVFSADGKMPDLQNQAQAESIVLSIFGMYNDIVAYLESGAFQPYLGPQTGVDGDPDPVALWCIGFSKGMHFLQQRWFDPEEPTLAQLLVPIYYFIDAEKFDKIFLGEAPTRDERDDLAMQMLLQLPLSVVDMYAYWRKKS